MKRLILIFIFPFYLFSCIQVVDGTTIDGKYINNLRGSFKPNIIKSIIKNGSAKTRLEDIIEQIKEDKLAPIQLKEHKALILLLKGDYNASIDLLLKIEKEDPGRYTVAANLGTAYELNGENTKAIKWIKKGISINSKSHYGSEWLHVLILKTKIKLASNPNFLQKNQIIPLPKKFKLDTIVNIYNKKYTIKNIKDAIEYQLKERIIFVKPKNEVVANLFFTLARITAQTGAVESAMEYLNIAQEYGYRNIELFDKTTRKYLSITENHTLTYYVKSFSNQDPAEMILLTLLFFFTLLLIVKILQSIYGLVKNKNKIN